MKKITSIVLILMLLIPLVCLAKGKIRIAVVKFDDNAVGHYWRSWRLGLAAQDAMVTELVKTEQFSVIERQKLEQIMKEQGLGASGAVTAQTAAKIGKLLGVQLLVTGSVTEFGKSDTGGGIGGLLGGNVEEYRTKLDVRLINTTTGEILLGVTGEGEATAGGAHIKGIRLGTKSSYGERAGAVMREAVEDIAEQIADKAEDLAEDFASSAKVAAVSGRKIYLNVGSNYGVQVGDRYSVVRQGEAIVDPDTGLELDRETTIVGELEVVTVKSKVAICKVVSGTVAKGDLVKKK